MPHSLPYNTAALHAGYGGQRNMNSGKEADH